MKRLEEAIFRWESAVLIGAVLVLTVFTAQGLITIPFLGWVWWYWLVLGGVGEGLIIASTLTEKPAKGAVTKQPKPASKPNVPATAPKDKVAKTTNKPAPPSSDLMNGVYRMEKSLGQGGMGTVYLVADTGAFDRPRIVKELLDYYDRTNPAEAAEAQQMFEQEARTLAELDHPGIPDILAYFTENERNYIVMEYIEGKNLEKLVEEKGKIPILNAVKYGVQICEVLEYLSGRAKPVMHLDIKPANIIVHKNSGRAVLVDFGTAKVHRADKVGKREALYGTVGYAAPEQYQGAAEPRSDVYALAATLYHVITGDDPTENPNKYPKLATMPGNLRKALESALEPDVKKRITAAEFRKLLEKSLQAKRTQLLP